MGRKVTSFPPPPIYGSKRSPAPDCYNAGERDTTIVRGANLNAAFPHLWFCTLTTAERALVGSLGPLKLGVLCCSLVSLVRNPVQYSKALKYVLSQKDSLAAYRPSLREGYTPSISDAGPTLGTKHGAIRRNETLQRYDMRNSPPSDKRLSIYTLSQPLQSLQLAPRVYRVSAEIFTSTLASLMNDFYSLGAAATSPLIRFFPQPFWALLVDFLHTAFLVMDRSTKD